ncbi:MAG: serine hydrolase [Ktedonobacterales bacterium]
MSKREPQSSQPDGNQPGQQPDEAPTTPTLTEQATLLLAPLGGRTALAARRIGRPKNATAAPVETAIQLRAEQVFPAASLAKLPIAVEVLRRADLGQFSLRERLDTSGEPRAGGGGVLDYLDPATRFTLDDLCALMLIVSDNSAANFLLDLVGMGEVNETISRMTLTQTKLARHFMDWGARATHRDNLTSADDLLALLALIHGGSLPGARRLRELLAAQQSFPELRDDWLPATAALAHKDGSLDDTLHDVGILRGPGGACLYAILTTEQRDLFAARRAIGQIVRLLWDEWQLG